MNEWKDIRAYRTGWLLAVLDRLMVLPGLRFSVWRTAQSLRLEYLNGAQKEIERDIRHGAFFLTNHRDICLDSAWLTLLLRSKYNIHPFIGIGNNLFGKWWIEPFVRFNRSFVVLRDGSPREVLQHSLVLSSYLRHLRREGHSIWLAQREGRAKDGNDRTQPAVLKMLTLSSDEGMSALDAIEALNICPVSLSYEYDPCDYLKAREMQLKRDNPAWRKEKEDDLLSMKTGIEGCKGRVVFRMTPSINRWIQANRSRLEAMSRNEQLQAVAQQIDEQIFAGYEVFERGAEFDAYITSRLAKIELPNKDEAYLRERLYEMYNNPVINHENCHFSGIL